MTRSLGIPPCTTYNDPLSKEHGAPNHLEEHSLGEREAEGLARVSVELDVDRVVGEPSSAVPSQRRGGGRKKKTKTGRERGNRDNVHGQTRERRISPSACSSGDKAKGERSLT